MATTMDGEWGRIGREAKEGGRKGGEREGGEKAGW